MRQLEKSQNTKVLSLGPLHFIFYRTPCPDKFFFPRDPRSGYINLTEGKRVTQGKRHRLSNPVWAILSCLSCPACPVLPVLFCLSCYSSPVLPVLFCLSHFACLILTVCPVLPVPFCLSCFCLSCPDCPVLVVLS
jgi:hypothetical protein